MGRRPSLPRAVSSEAEFSPMPRPREGSAEGVSSEAEITCASRGLGREPSNEAEFAPQLARPRRGCTVELDRGPNEHLGFSSLEWLRASEFGHRHCSREGFGPGA